MVVFEGVVLLTVVPKPFSPEHVYYKVLSPDKKMIALFSIKYQGVISWLPSDIEPYCYLTIVDSEHGRIRMRKTEYHGTMEGNFIGMAQKYAPWAAEEIASGF